jgi:tRNA-dihydrouridine synthase
MLTFIHAIDFNLGCPQDRARDGLFGSYLLDERHWPLVFSCVQAMSDELNGTLPLFCKIRICEGSNNKDRISITEAFCKGLYDSGADLICIHGRTRGSAKHRRAGPADLKLIAHIASKFSGTIPIVANGNILSRDDVGRVLSECEPAMGVMSAEGILADPCIFYHARRTTSPCVNAANTVNSTDSPATSPMTPDRAALFSEYCELSEEYLKLGGWRALSRCNNDFMIGVTDSANNAGASIDDVYCSTVSTEQISSAPLLRDGNIVTHEEVNEELHQIENQNDAMALQKQLDVARQHLTWMLQKSGHGRSVRFVHVGTYKKHTSLLNALKEATSLAELVAIANECLQGVQGSAPYCDDD